MKNLTVADFKKLLNKKGHLIDDAFVKRHENWKGTPLDFLRNDTFSDKDKSAIFTNPYFLSENTLAFISIEYARVRQEFFMDERIPHFLNALEDYHLGKSTKKEMELAYEKALEAYKEAKKIDINTQVRHRMAMLKVSSWPKEMDKQKKEILSELKADFEHAHNIYTAYSFSVLSYNVKPSFMVSDLPLLVKIAIKVIERHEQ